MRLQTLFFAAIFAASSTTALAAPFSRLFVFGDSTSDNGNLSALVDASSPGPGPIVPAPPYAFGHASNGPVAVEYLSVALGLGPLLPAALPVGTNFAVIGAATGPVPVPGGGVADNLATAIGLPLSTPTGMLNAQLPLFFERYPGAIDPNALFVIWGGANDLFINPSPQVAAAAAANIGTMIDRLYFEGARNFLVPNMPDIGLTPGAANPSAATTLSQLFNAQLTGQLAARVGRPGISLQAFDTFSLFRAVVASPETYGFLNVEDECYQGPLLGIGGVAQSVCAVPNAYLFWDQSHPTAAAHALLGAAFADAVQPDAVPEPGTTTLAGLSIAGLLVWRRRAA